MRTPDLMPLLGILPKIDDSWKPKPRGVSIYWNSEDSGDGWYIETPIYSTKTKAVIAWNKMVVKFNLNNIGKLED